jgi:hypothetical protein
MDPFVQLLCQRKDYLVRGSISQEAYDKEVHKRLDLLVRKASSVDRTEKILQKAFDMGLVSVKQMQTCMGSLLDKAIEGELQVCSLFPFPHSRSVKNRSIILNACCFEIAGG